MSRAFYLCRYLRVSFSSDDLYLFVVVVVLLLLLLFFVRLGRERLEGYYPDGRSFLCVCVFLLRPSKDVIPFKC